MLFSLPRRSRWSVCRVCRFPRSENYFTFKTTPIVDALKSIFVTQKQLKCDELGDSRNWVEFMCGMLTIVIKFLPIFIKSKNISLWKSGKRFCRVYWWWTHKEISVESGAISMEMCWWISRVAVVQKSVYVLTSYQILVAPHVANDPSKFLFFYRPHQFCFMIRSALDMQSK